MSGQPENTASGNTHPNPQKTVLVIGGGISGITAAVEAAETGCQVYLVERLPYLGGQVSRMNEYFPKLCPPYCGLEINFKRIRNNPRIEVITSTTVEKISGSAGDFTVSLSCEPEYVTPECTSCGDCSSVCPVETDNPFNYGMTRHKAIDLPHELAYPNRFYLDDSVCTKDNCHQCASACKYDAINLEAKPFNKEIKAGSVLFCTGWESYDPENLTEYSWGLSPDIINNVMMERLGAPNGPTNGKILRQSDDKPAQRIAFVQCAGSRDENHLPYCSAVCCSASLKQAAYFLRQDPQNRADIYYIDLRLSGRNEDFLKSIEAEENIRLIKGKVSGIDHNEGELFVEAEDILEGKKIREQYDMIVLASGIVPNVPAIEGFGSHSEGSDDPAEGFLDGDGFIIKDSLEHGFSAGGCCFEPKDVAAAVRESTGLVIKVLQQKTEPKK